MSRPRLEVARPRTEAELVECLDKAQWYVEPIKRNGWDPSSAAYEIIDYCEQAELILIKPEEAFDTEKYELRMISILKSAIHNTRVRRNTAIDSGDTYLTRLADKASVVLHEYVHRARLDIA
ncbi:MAG: hypothetical protein WC906_00690 [Parcubacteria group bacterium]|jgi:hypothetical protein